MRYKEAFLTKIGCLIQRRLHPTSQIGAIALITSRGLTFHRIALKSSDSLGKKSGFEQCGRFVILEYLFPTCPHLRVIAEVHVNFFSRFLIFTLTSVFVFFPTPSVACLNCYGLDSCGPVYGPGFERCIVNCSGGGCFCVAYIACYKGFGAMGQPRMSLASAASPWFKSASGTEASPRNCPARQTSEGSTLMFCSEPAKSGMTFSVDAGLLMQLVEVDKNAALAIEMLRRTSTPDAKMTFDGDMEGYVDGSISKANAVLLINGQSVGRSTQPMPLKFALARTSSQGKQVEYRMVVQGSHRPVRLFLDFSTPAVANLVHWALD